jgi:hypothetical protein
MRLAKANGGKKENPGEEHPEIAVQSNSQSSGVRLPAGVSASACYFLKCSHASTEAHLSLIFVSAASSSESSIKFGSIDPKQLVRQLMHFLLVSISEYTADILQFFPGREGEQGSTSC